MNFYWCDTRPKTGDRGFTLIEVLIVVILVAVLAAVAMPAYNGSIRKSRRSEAIAALTAAQQAQERWRANNAQYTGVLSDLGVASTTTGGYYGVAIDVAGASAYVVSAQAVSGTSQTADANCTTLRVQLLGGNVSYGSCDGCAAPTAPLSAALSDPNRCWSR